MRTIIEQIEKKQKLFHSKGSSIDQVIAAEKHLGLKFSDEFRNYVLQYGAISFGSHEFTGLNVEDYINVVSVTLEERKVRSDFPQEAVVIEQLGIEGITIVQDAAGTVYELNEAGESKQIANSFAQYLESLL